jgi:capsular exopolysaccharide synthesis family protein
MFTSPGPGEGKTTTCANLGVVLAQAHKRTLVVDCDLRKPALHKLFGLRNVRGLTNILAGEYDLQDVWMEPLQGLKVVTVGQLPFNPTEVLSSRRYTDFLRRVRQDFDYVLLNASPIQPVSDALIFASQADAVLVVFDAQRTHEGPVRRAIHALGAVEANVLGTVINNAKPP